MQKFTNAFLPGTLDALKTFKLDPSRGPKPNEQLIPPPVMTDHPLPFNWGYHQNPTIKTSIDPTTGAKTLTNTSAPAKLGTLYISHTVASVPTQAPPVPTEDIFLLNLVTSLREALNERPIWTRRALSNRLRDHPSLYLLKPAIQYIGYQFRGGPWRDAIIRYGVDPRSDPKYRYYQTLFFKIFDESERVPGAPWTDIRSEYTRRLDKTISVDGEKEGVDVESHLFDGRKLCLDGKVWQVCDITDPLIQRICATSTLREKCDLESDGWYCNGTWAKIKAVMRTKITAIRAGKTVPDSAFSATLATPDIVTGKGMTKISVPVPDLRKYGVENGSAAGGGRLRNERKKRIRTQVKGRGRRGWDYNRRAELSLLPDEESGDLDESSAPSLPGVMPSVEGRESTVGGHASSDAYGEEEYDDDDDGVLHDDEEDEIAYGEDGDDQVEGGDDDMTIDPALR
jgi:general transcription factor 3C polypeptide 5 (transcription factor C subunit 1)